MGSKHKTVMNVAKSDWCTKTIPKPISTTQPRGRNKEPIPTSKALQSPFPSIKKNVYDPIKRKRQDQNAFLVKTTGPKII